MLPYFDVSELVARILTHMADSRSFLVINSGPAKTAKPETMLHVIDASTVDDIITVSIAVRPKSKS